MKKADRITGLVVVIFGIVVILLTRGFPSPAMPGTPGPGFLPRLIASGLIVCGVLLFLRSMMGKDSKRTEFASDSFPRVLAVMVLLALLPAGLAYLGFLLTCFVSCLVFFIILRLRLLSSVIIALCISVVIYIAFHYGLQVQFPKEIFW